MCSISRSKAYVCLVGSSCAGNPGAQLFQNGITSVCTMIDFQVPEPTASGGTNYATYPYRFKSPASAHAPMSAFLATLVSVVLVL